MTPNMLDFSNLSSFDSLQTQMTPSMLDLSNIISRLATTKMTPNMLELSKFGSG